MLDDLVIVHPPGPLLFLALFILYPLFEAEQANLISAHGELQALGISLVALDLNLVISVPLTIAVLKILFGTLGDVEELLLIVHEVLFRGSQRLFDLRQENLLFAIISRFGLFEKPVYSFEMVRYRLVIVV